MTFDTQDKNKNDNLRQVGDSHTLPHVYSKMMFNNISEKDILDVFLESDTDEEECPIIDNKVSKKDSKIFLKAPNNLDVDDETSKNVVDLTSNFPPC